jgi:hypothetical protein
MKYLSDYLWHLKETLIQGVFVTAVGCCFCPSCVKFLFKSHLQMMMMMMRTRRIMMLVVILGGAGQWYVKVCFRICLIVVLEIN